MENYSTLMSVYKKENPDYLRQSIQSMLDQTIPTDDFVLICDGPLTPELDLVIDQFVQQRPELFQVIRISENIGIGGAANEGLRHCKNDLVAKIDSDDVARPERCEKQLAVFESEPTMALVGGQLAEFNGTPDNIVAVRDVPVAQEDIIEYAKRRMPFNNQTVMYRRVAVEEAGGYRLLRRCEDYDLYVRMLQNNVRAKNLEDILVDFRLNDDAYHRRGMWQNLKNFILVRWQIHKSGFSGFSDFLIPCAAQFLLTVLPNKLKNVFYLFVLRSKRP